MKFDMSKASREDLEVVAKIHLDGVGYVSKDVTQRLRSQCGMKTKAELDAKIAAKCREWLKQERILDPNLVRTPMPDELIKLCLEAFDDSNPYYEVYREGEPPIMRTPDIELAASTANADHSGKTFWRLEGAGEEAEEHPLDDEKMPPASLTGVITSRTLLGELFKRLRQSQLRDLEVREPDLMEAIRSYLCG